MPDLTCTRCQKTIFPAEQPIRVPGGDYHNSCFKCKQCGTKITLSTYTSKNGEVWCKSHIPHDTPHQVLDVTLQGQTNVPDSKFSGRSISEKGGDKPSLYGHGAVQISTQTSIPDPNLSARTLVERGGDQPHHHNADSLHIQGPLHAQLPPTNVDRVNMMELRHQSVQKYSSAQ